MTKWHSYFYAGTDVLQNRFSITDADELERMERFIVEQRIAEGCPLGTFDLDHLRAIHYHLFQDVYEWAGELRTVSMVKGDSSFIPHDRIEMGMADVHRRLVNANFLRELDAWAFAAKAGEIIGDVNHVHPFREGNGRTQLQYLQLLAEQAGHSIDLTRFERDAWIKASIESNAKSCGLMIDHIHQAIVAARDKVHSPEKERVGFQTSLSSEELAGIREAFKSRDDNERRILIDAHKAQRADLPDSADEITLAKLAERQALEVFEQQNRQKADFLKHVREREEKSRQRQERRRDEGGDRER
jgi:cell filamentation protein